ncbi:MAG: hypothetical protein K5639_03905 [Eubacterium sp.]|nr:hypothetical protein [Eubacterium sp.]
MRRVRKAITIMMVFAMAVNLTPAVSAPKSEAASKTYRTETVYDPISVPAVLCKKTKIYNSDLTTEKEVSKKKITLAKATEITVIGEKTKDNKKWFKISFLNNKKTVKAYVKSSVVDFKLETSTTAKIFNVSTTKTLRVEAEAATKVKQGKTKVTVKNGTKVNIIAEKYVGTVKWYLISFKFNKKATQGYISPKYVKLAKKARKVKVYPLTEAEFEEAMTKEGVPDSYKPYLRVLHKDYPFWEFKIYNTGIKWKTALKAESKVGVNMVSKGKSAAWKSKEKGAYDSKTKTWKILDGTNWVAASEKAVAYYMDPRNFLNERTIFQFELLEYKKEYQKEDTVAKILSNTPFANKKFKYVNPSTKKTSKMKYSKAFMEAAKESGVSPLHLASRVKQEVVTSATTTSGAVTGKNKNYPGIYNFYNIGAYSGKNPMENGLKWASSTEKTYMRPWTDPYRSIIGGATYIAKGYIKNGQNTIYLEKFDVTPYQTYDHQYMTNVEGATSEAQKVKKAYEEAGLLKKTPLVFSIPVYKSMPKSNCKAPK